ncbi:MULTISPECIES: Shedu anti-phage system protein SduA domain-containing protein [Streptomyces]|uniref:Shedu anti-phage system protein SduA domain-containing protein n=1 Tax=Streptomyces TaxID=1883 RepID=UPI00099D290C|nr:Shedu anti-phage system protein SduA domain-containing protein [Streptomyces sp. NRRL B-1381]
MATDEVNAWGLEPREEDGLFGTKNIEIKSGPRVYKRASISVYGSPTSGEIKKEELRLESFARKIGSNEFDFDNPKDRWFCENGEIERLVAFLSGAFSTAGRYRLIDTASASTTILSLLDSGDLDPGTLGEALAEHGDLKEVISALTASASGLHAVEVATIARRRGVLTDLKRLAVQSDTTETDMQGALEGHTWIFGGQYIGIAHRRNLAMLDEHDIPLVEPNGALHIVELKGPKIKDLVKRYRNHLIVGNEVHQAVGQLMNYLKQLDQQGAAMEQVFRNEHGVEYDMSRLCGTVIIGHSHHVSDYAKKSIDQAIRTFNSHLTRVQVLTYEDLLDRAEMALRFEEGSLP